MSDERMSEFPALSWNDIVAQNRTWNDIVDHNNGPWNDIVDHNGPWNDIVDHIELKLTYK